MKKLILPFVALLIGMAACQKEDTNVLTLEVEHYNGDAKMHIDNQDFAVWDDGDTVWLNGTPKRVTVNYCHATISASNLAEESEDYYASYPYVATMVTGRRACNITLPAVQKYKEVNGRQKVAAPMLAYDNYEGTLKFRNVGSVLAVKVKNYTCDPLSVRRIQVIADNQNYLWGNGNVGLTGEASLFCSTLLNGGDTVTLDCGDGVEVPAEGKVFYIALPAISGAHLTVKVDDGYGIYTLAQNTNTATFDRNTLHQVPFSATVNNYVNYLERPKIKYTATSKLSGFDAGTTIWGKKVLRHDYDETSMQGTITFDSEITEIPDDAFWGNGALLSVELPESVETIEEESFYECSSLTSVSMPGVKTIGTRAFAYCHALTTVNLPSATSIGGNAFYDCSALTTVNIPSVTSIGDDAFCDCHALATLNLPSVTSIGNNAFFNCTALATLNLPSVTSIGSKAFKFCSALTTLNLPSIIRISSYAFSFSGIQNITLGPNLGSLGIDIFAICEHITDIYCKAQNPPRSDINGINHCCFTDMNIYSTPTLHVPSGKGAAYANDDVWGPAFGNTWGSETRILEDCPE